VVLWGILALRGQARPLPARRIAGFVLMGAFLSGSATASFIAVQRIPAALAALLFYIYPALIAAASALLYGTRYTLSRLLVLVASLAGCALTVDVQTGSLNVLGVVLALASAFFYTGYVLVASRATRGVPALNASAWVITAAAPLMLLAGLSGLVGGRLTTQISGVGWLALLGLAIFSTVLSISTFLAGIARIDVFRAAILSTFEPVVSVALAALLLDERLTAQQGLGGVVIVGAGVALQLIARREGRRNQRP
jgi:drug/metabolite transporter (DMT)-like permease